jgi:hypothetical protein
MDLIERLPKVKDFRQYGKFHHLPNMNSCTELPLILLYHIFPNYLFESKELDHASKEVIKKHCAVLQEQAKYEDDIEDLKIKKELQIRRLEECMHKFYAEKYKYCKCLHLSK